MSFFKIPHSSLLQSLKKQLVITVYRLKVNKNFKVNETVSRNVFVLESLWNVFIDASPCYSFQTNLR